MVTTSNGDVLGSPSLLQVPKLAIICRKAKQISPSLSADLVTLEYFFFVVVERCQSSV